MAAHGLNPTMRTVRAFIMKGLMHLPTWAQHNSSRIRQADGTTSLNWLSGMSGYWHAAQYQLQKKAACPNLPQSCTFREFLRHRCTKDRQDAAAVYCPQQALDLTLTGRNLWCPRVTPTYTICAVRCAAGAAVSKQCVYDIIAPAAGVAAAARAAAIAAVGAVAAAHGLLVGAC